MDVATAGKCVEQLQLAQARHQRPSGYGELELSITPPKPPTKAMIEDYAALGIHRVIPMLGFYNADSVLGELDTFAAAVL